MPDKEFIQILIQSAIKGKQMALHAYDKMMWMVRSGFLTLVFAGWGLIIKAAIETKSAQGEIAFYIFLLAAFSLALAAGGYVIDKNYAKRKFRVVACMNQMMELIVSLDYDHIETIKLDEIVSLLKISGEADNENWQSMGYANEKMIRHVIYGVPSILIVGIIVYYLINFGY